MGSEFVPDQVYFVITSVIASEDCESTIGVPVSSFMYTLTLGYPIPLVPSCFAHISKVHVLPTGIVPE